MLLFDNLQKSSDLAMYNVDAQLKSDTQIVKEKFELASKIAKEFLTNILADTLTNTSPTNTYNFDIEDDVNLNDLRHVVDEIIYRIFNKNFYAIPDVFCSPHSDVKPVSKIIIYAPNTVKSFLTADTRLETEISSLLLDKRDILNGGDEIIYTGFEHHVSSLPMAYMQSRSEHILKMLDDKGYKTIWEPTSMYITISIK